MAEIDYGALLKVDGVFVNKNRELFMNMKELVGYENKLDGYFFVFAGDEELLFCIYKCSLIVFDKALTELLHVGWHSEFPVKANVKGVEVEVDYLDLDNMGDRYKAQWEYNERQYEAIYGYGIDQDEDVWKEIQGEYGFSDSESETINEWFK